jgi:hypothetical protein
MTSELFRSRAKVCLEAVSGRKLSYAGNRARSLLMSRLRNGTAFECRVMSEDESQDGRQEWEKCDR